MISSILLKFLTKLGPFAFAVWERFIKPSKLNFKPGNRRVLTVGVTGIALFFVLFLMANRMQSMDTQLQLAMHNSAALSDSLEYHTTRNGEIEASRLALIGDKEELFALSDGLRVELEAEKGNVKTITRIETVIKSDTVRVPVFVETDAAGFYNLNWSDNRVFGASSRSLEGFTRFQLNGTNILEPVTVITRDELRLKLTTGLRETDEGLQVFVRSDYPGITYNIDGAFLDPKYFVAPKPKKWGLGIIGGYDPINGRFIYGVGMSRNIIRFNLF